MTKLFQMYDHTANIVHGPIFTEKSNPPAIRWFHAVLSDTNTLPGKYPEQFSLVCLAIEDEESGRLTAPEQPEIIATGEAWRAERDNVREQTNLKLG